MTQVAKELDPFTFEVFYNRLFNLLCESRDVIRHLSASAISRESGETAEGVFLPDGELILLSPGLLLHLNTVARVIGYMLQNRMGEDVGFELEASTFSGEIESEFPMTVTSSSKRRRSISAVVGDGSAVIEATTFSGDVEIRSR